MGRCTDCGCEREGGLIRVDDTRSLCVACYCKAADAIGMAGGIAYVDEESQRLAREKRMYTCTACKRRCMRTSDWTEEAAIQEFRDLHGRDPTEAEIGKPVCDDCFRLIMQRAAREGWKA